MKNASQRTGLAILLSGWLGLSPTHAEYTAPSTPPFKAVKSELFFLTPRAVEVGKMAVGSVAVEVPDNVQLFYFGISARPTQGPAKLEFRIVKEDGTVLTTWIGKAPCPTWAPVEIPTANLPTGTYRVDATMTFAGDPWQRVSKELLVVDSSMADAKSVQVPLEALGGTTQTHSNGGTMIELPEGNSKKVPLPEGRFALYVAVESDGQAWPKGPDIPKYLHNDRFTRPLVPSPQFSVDFGTGEIGVKRQPMVPGTWQEVFCGVVPEGAKTFAIHSKAPWRIWGVRLERLTKEDIALLAHKPGKGDKVVAVNYDGYSQDIVYPDFTPAKAVAVVDKFKGSSVTLLEWTALSSGVVSFKSQYATFLGDVDEGLSNSKSSAVAIRNLRKLSESGLCYLGIARDAAKAIGLTLDGSLRMNHYAYSRSNESHGTALNGALWHATGLTMRMMDAEGPGKYQDQMSYAFPEVRAQRIGVLCEMVEKGCRGVNMDFNRYPAVLGYEQPMLDRFQKEYGEDGRSFPLTDLRWMKIRQAVMNDFMRDARKALHAVGEARGSSVFVSVRLPSARPGEWGLDPATWAKEGLVDAIIPSIIGASERWFPLEPWMKMVEGTRTQIWVGTEAIRYVTSRTELNDEELAAGKKPGEAVMLPRDRVLRRANEAYSSGAGGMYFFNNWLTPELYDNVGDPVFVRAWAEFEDWQNLGNALIASIPERVVASK